MKITRFRWSVLTVHNTAEVGFRHQAYLVEAQSRRQAEIKAVAARRAVVGKGARITVVYVENMGEVEG